MRLTTSVLGASSLLALFALASLAALAAPSAHANPLGNVPPEAPAAPAAGADKPTDLLGTMTVVASSARALPKLGVVPSLSADLEDVTLRGVVRRDLDLCGEFDVLAESAAPDGLYLSDSAVDTKAWGHKGAEAVIRVIARRTGDKPEDEVELVGQAYLVKSGATPVFEKKVMASRAAVRTASHRMADVLIGALTGQNGGFASRMTFAAGAEKVRRVYVIDADGHGARAASAESEVALGPAFGKSEELYYASSTGNAQYEIRSESGKDYPLPVSGSVYGVAFSKDRSKVAVSIGIGASIRLFAGADFASIAPASNAPFAMEPTFSPGGKLAFVGLGLTGQRIYVDEKPVTPEGVFAMSPTFCNHPDGVRLVFAAGVSTDADLFATGEQGGTLVRLTQDQGKNSAPSCSPDGRLVAFFSTRKTGEGPGLYIMRADGLRPKRISPLMGDSLRWDALPPDVSIKAAPAAQSSHDPG